MSAQRSVRLERLSSSVWGLTIDRPDKRNALTEEMARQMIKMVGEVCADVSARALLIRGNGPVFCAGADLAELEEQREGNAASRYLRQSPLIELIRLLSTCDVPVVCAVQGGAVGGGMAIVAASTFGMAASTCRFGLPEVGLGIVPAALVPFIATRVGVHRAMNYALLGEALDAQEALQHGLVDVVVEASDLQERSELVLERLSSLDGETVRAGMRIRSTLIGASDGASKHAYGSLLDAVFNAAP